MKRRASPNEKADRATKLLNAFRNHPIVAVIIVIGTAIIAIANFTDAISKIREIFIGRDILSQQVIELTELEVQSVLSKERGNIEKCLRGTTANFIGLEFVIDKGKVVSIRIWREMESDSLKFPPPQGSLMAPLLKHGIGPRPEGLVLGLANDCVIDILLKYKFISRTRTIIDENGKVTDRFSFWFYFFPDQIMTEEQLLQLRAVLDSMAKEEQVKGKYK